MHVAAVHVGLPVDEPDALRGGTFHTAVRKHRSESPLWLSHTNLDGDRQGDLRHHGGPEKAVMAYALVHYEKWRAELGIEAITEGAFGENLTLDGLDEATVCIGDTWRIGTALTQVSQPRQPCWKLAARWGVPGLALTVQRSGRTGWYHRVLREGRIGPGDEMVLIDRPHPQWTATRANQVMHSTGAALADIEALVALPELSSNWHATLAARLSGVGVNTATRLVG